MKEVQLSKRVTIKEDSKNHWFIYLDDERYQDGYYYSSEQAIESFIDNLLQERSDLMRIKAAFRLLSR